MKSILALVLFALISSSPAKAGAIPGVEGPFIDFIDGKIHIDVAFTKLTLPGFLGVVIPKLPNSSVVLNPNIEGGTLATISIDPQDLKIIKGVVTQNAYVLPDGRPIPGIPGGKIREGLRLDLKPSQYSLSFYYHQKLFGFYVPLSVNYKFPINQAAIELKWKNKPVGSLHLVGPQGAKKAAFLIFLRLKDIEENPEIMEKLLRPKN
jgi:hypothetical protein